MKPLTVEDYELLGFFESEPVRQGLDKLWVFDDSVYEAIDRNVRLTLAIHPSHKDIRLILWQSETKIYEYEKMDVEDVKFEGSTLTIFVNEQEVISVQIRPNIIVKHSVKT